MAHRGYVGAPLARALRIERLSSRLRWMLDRDATLPGWRLCAIYAGGRRTAR